MVEYVCSQNSIIVAIKTENVFDIKYIYNFEFWHS